MFFVLLAIVENKSNGKEFDRMHGLDTYDYGARQYDPARITWDRMDQLCEKYYHINPYVYCGGNPVSRIDIGGSLIIFINGFHFGDGGSSDYWENVDKKIINHFNDHSTPLYYDGSMNGGIGLLTSVINSQPSYNSIFINNRIHQGYMDGKRDAKSIFANLEANEMIRIVTHSMGAAYAKGFIKALINYIKKNPKLKKYLSKIIEYDFAPFQPEQQNAVSEITTYQYSHQNDKVAGNACEDGAIMMTTNLSDEYGHPITDFMRYIQSLPQGTYHIVNGQIKRCKFNIELQFSGR